MIMMMPMMMMTMMLINGHHIDDDDDDNVGTFKFVVVEVKSFGNVDIVPRANL